MALKFAFRIFFCLLSPLCLYGQTVTTNPQFPKAGEPVTITVDVTGTSLDGFAWNHETNPVWIWTWIDNDINDIDAPTNVNPATSAQDAAKATRISVNPDKYQVTFTPATFFNKPASEIKKIGLKLKSRDWNDNKQTDNDRYIEFSEGFEAAFIEPNTDLLFKNPGETVNVQVKTSAAAAIVLKVNEQIVAQENNVVELTHTLTVPQSTGDHIEVVSEADNGTEKKTISFTIIVRSPVETQSRPAGIVDGINYHEDLTRATLSLWAPAKSSVYVVGDFSGWKIDSSYRMKKDGEHFWVEITGLNPGQEYAYQYLVDETIRIADPYADKILDPDDQYIPATVYPNLKAFPQEALSEKWYFNRVAVLQTGQQAYEWLYDDYQRPAKEELTIYELLIRDFFGSDSRSYKTLADTINYLKRLGVNTVELMPVMEFNGNDSWGYNPTFMFAPDKYYGPKNELKAFVDQCHQSGIAVILDIAMNHHDAPNPYVMMDFDFTAFKPTAENKWFNVNATHPYSVFFDMNHESFYTKKYLDTVNYYWLNEYHVDGFRFDLSKGFTQKYSGSDVSGWSIRDESRIAILKRMADNIWTHSPDAYIILEHFADNAEEKELASYRADEGKGMLLWGNMNHAYGQNTMGYPDNSDISWIDHAVRGWSQPHVVGYMESHDEERLMYKNLTYGSLSGAYNVKNTKTALERMKAAGTIFYLLPGPKMLWQFGETGFDKSINLCSDGSVSDGCRLAAKPPLWNYLQEPERKSLFDHTTDLLRLRDDYDVFSSGKTSFSGGNTLVKQVTLKNAPYTSSPAGAGDMNAQIVVNFGLTDAVVPTGFPHTGVWYDYYKNEKAVNVTAIPFNISLKPGEYRLFTDVHIENPLETVVSVNVPQEEVKIAVYPNPAGEFLNIKWNGIRVLNIHILNLQGKKIKTFSGGETILSLQGLLPGLYIAEMETPGSSYRFKIIKK